MGFLNKTNKQDTSSCNREGDMYRTSIIFPTNPMRSEVNIGTTLMGQIQYLLYTIEKRGGMAHPFEVTSIIRDFLIFNQDAGCVIVRTSLESNSESNLHIIVWKNCCIDRKWYGKKIWKKINVFDILIKGLPNYISFGKHWYTPTGLFIKRCFLRNIQSFHKCWVPHYNGGENKDLDIDWLLKR